MKLFSVAMNKENQKSRRPMNTENANQTKVLAEKALKRENNRIKSRLSKFKLAPIGENPEIDKD